MDGAAVEVEMLAVATKSTAKAVAWIGAQGPEGVIQDPESWNAAVAVIDDMRDLTPAQCQQLLHSAAMPSTQARQMARPSRHCRMSPSIASMQIGQC